MLLILEQGNMILQSSEHDGEAAGGISIVSTFHNNYANNDYK